MALWIFGNITNLVNYSVSVICIAVSIASSIFATNHVEEGASKVLPYFIVSGVALVIGTIFLAIS